MDQGLPMGDRPLPGEHCGVNIVSRGICGATGRDAGIQERTFVVLHGQLLPFGLNFRRKIEMLANDPRRFTSERHGRLEMLHADLANGEISQRGGILRVPDA